MSRGSGYISGAILGNDYISASVGGKTYKIYPPTIEVIAGVGDALKDVRTGEDMTTVLGNIFNLRPFAVALSRMVGEDIIDEVMRGYPEEIIDALEKGLSLISADDWERSIGFDVERNDSKSETAGNATLLGQIATFMDSLHLSYNEVVREIPYRNLVIMQKDKLHTVFGTKVHKASGKEMAARRTRKDDC